MKFFGRCCLGPEDQRLAGQALSLAKEPTGRNRSTSTSALSQACAAALASLPILSCDQWPQRILTALANLEASLRCAPRLIVYSSEGLPWVFSPTEWLPEDSDRITLIQLADVLSNQTSEEVAVICPSSDTANGHNVCNVMPWACSPGQTLVLEPSDHLALPICQPGTHTTAALLLSWDRTIATSAPTAKGAASEEKPQQPPGATRLLAADVKELRRLAQFLGYGLLGDPQHARYVVRVCRYLALMPSALSLHDIIITVLDGVHDLVLTKFGIQFYPILAVIHGTSSPAVLFAQRPNVVNAIGGSGGGASFPGGSDRLPHLAAVTQAYESSSGLALQRPNVAGMTVLNSMPGLEAPPSGGAVTAGNCGRQEPSRIRAIKISLAHTLLLQAARTACTTSTDNSATKDAASRFSPQPSAASVRIVRRDGSKANASSGSVVRSSPAAAPAGASHTSVRPQNRTVSVIPVIVPNASSHVLEDHQPCRDLLLCSKLTGAKAGSILLMSELAPVAETSLTNHSVSRGKAPRLLERLMASPAKDAFIPKVVTPIAANGGGDVLAQPQLAGSEDDTPAGCVTHSSDCGFTAARVAAAGVHGAAAAASPTAGVRQVPYQLALYLLSSDVLPVGVLRIVADELRALLPMIFRTWRLAMTAAETSGLSYMASEWLRLQEQLLGMALAGPDVPSGIAGFSSIGGLSGMGVLDASATPAHAAIYESACNSPLSPAAALQSSCSTRLFRSNAQASMSPAAASSTLKNAAASPPPMLWGGSGGIVSGGPLSPQLPPRTITVGMSQGGSMVKKGLLAMLAMRDEAGTGGPAAAAALPDSVTYESGGGGSRSPKLAPKAADLTSAGGLSSAGGGSTSSATPRALGGLLSGHLGNWLVPQVTLEKNAGAASAVDMLVCSMRQGLAAAASLDDQHEMVIRAQDLAAVQLLEVLGRGGQGVVFRGSLHGLETAVKVLTDPAGGVGGAEGGRKAVEAEAGLAADVAGGEGGGGGGADVGSDVDTWDMDGKAGEARMRQAKRGAMEVAVIGTLSHPSIVQVYATFSGVVVVRCQYHDSPHAEMRLCYPGDDLLAGKDPGPLNQVICLEYCDAGTMFSAARSGAFRLPFALPTNGSAFPALVPLYKSLLEVALALRYLHARRLVHCDLKAANVLLKSSSRDLRGWTCKLSDFGCARMLTEVDAKAGGPVGFRTAAPVGTLAHMAPECFIKNSLLTASIDIYSFGVLMWELLMCNTPYPGINAKDIPRQVIRNHLRPTFHPLAPQDFCALAARCWSSSPERRPTAMELVGELEQLLTAAHAAAEREAQVAGAAAVTRRGGSAAASGSLVGGGTAVGSGGSGSGGGGGGGAGGGSAFASAANDARRRALLLPHRDGGRPPVAPPAPAPAAAAASMGVCGSSGALSNRAAVRGGGAGQQQQQLKSDVSPSPYLSPSQPSARPVDDGLCNGGDGGDVVVTVPTPRDISAEARDVNDRTGHSAAGAILGSPHTPDLPSGKTQAVGPGRALGSSGELCSVRDVRSSGPDMVGGMRLGASEVHGSEVCLLPLTNQQDLL